MFPGSHEFLANISDHLDFITATAVPGLMTATTMTPITLILLRSSSVQSLKQDVQPWDSGEDFATPLALFSFSWMEARAANGRSPSAL